MGAVMDGGGASAMELTSAKRLTAVTRTGIGYVYSCESLDARYVLTRMGAGMDGGGASAIGLTSAKRLSAVTGTGEAKLGLGRPKGLKSAPDPPFAPFPATSHALRRAATSLTVHVRLGVCRGALNCLA